ncbi:TPA: helix-turn-helix domain-containing protein [Pseudomonas aeruginosa]|nr:helix-turn-helix domain-containing protein [Pseudomonas aeruginosa]
MQFPSSREIGAAIELNGQWANALSSEVEIHRIALIDQQGTRQVIEIPALAFRFLGEVLAAIAAGNSAWILPVPSELTLAEAGRYLGVSKRHLLSLLSEGAIPHATGGRRSRIKLADMLVYEEQRNAVGPTTIGEQAS